MILLVEDDEDVREMLDFSLSSRGFAVEVVKNGADALEAMTRQRPCLVILDLHMPVMTGWELIARMKTSGYSNIPVCITSAMDTGIPTEAVARLAKPFDTRELIAIASRFCPHRTDGPHAATGV